MRTQRRELSALPLIRSGTQTPVNVTVPWIPYKLAPQVLTEYFWTPSPLHYLQSNTNVNVLILGYWYDLMSCSCVLIGMEANKGLIAGSVVLLFLSVTIIITL